MKVRVITISAGFFAIALVVTSLTMTRRSNGDLIRAGLGSIVCIMADADRSEVRGLSRSGVVWSVNCRSKSLSELFINRGTIDYGNLPYSRPNLCVVTDSTSIRVVDTLRQITLLAIRTKCINHVAFLERDILAVACDDGKISLWDVGTSTRIGELVGKGDVTAISSSADGKWLAVGHSRGVCELWDVSTKTLAHEFRGTTPGTQGYITWVIPLSGSEVAFGTNKGEGALVLLNGDEVIHKTLYKEFTGTTVQARLSKSGQSVAMALKGYNVWSSGGGAVIVHPDHAPQWICSGEVCDLAFVSDGIVVADGDGNLRLYRGDWK